jgi:hypothetical protein
MGSNRIVLHQTTSEDIDENVDRTASEIIRKIYGDPIPAEAVEESSALCEDIKQRLFISATKSSIKKASAKAESLGRKAAQDLFSEMYHLYGPGYSIGVGFVIAEHDEDSSIVKAVFCFCTPQDSWSDKKARGLLGFRAMNNEYELEFAYSPGANLALAAFYSLCFRAASDDQGIPRFLKRALFSGPDGGVIMGHCRKIPFRKLDKGKVKVEVEGQVDGA